MIKVQEKWLFRKYAQTWVSFLTECIRVTFKIQGIHATGFKRAQGNQHCAKSESHTNRVTFETNAIMMIVKVHPLYFEYYSTKLKRKAFEKLIVPKTKPTNWIGYLE